MAILSVQQTNVKNFRPNDLYGIKMFKLFQIIPISSLLRTTVFLGRTLEDSTDLHNAYSVAVVTMIYPHLSRSYRPTSSSSSADPLTFLSSLCESFSPINQ